MTTKLSNLNTNQTISVRMKAKLFCRDILLKRIDLDNGDMEPGNICINVLYGNIQTKLITGCMPVRQS